MAGETVLTIIGNLTADPELRTVGNGSQVASFTIASTPRTYNRNTNQWEDGQALFMRCSVWRDMAAHVARSMSKGMRVIAQGRLSQRSYQDKNGANRTVVEMTVDEIGPSLRYAVAQVQRQTQNGGGNGFQQQSQQSSAWGQQNAQAPAGDPWGGNAGSNAEFGEGDPNDAF
ncbi:single-stranded DNA-binding protein [Bifidobacterium aemilianum]|uniref:Single-stranded DNA-binding protein n=1 Tax=Bifidobacterium aemilianum TaxID=2493120 RepID=A0A366KAU2_9BIFI|nr:single-stranded DNA-binding protein [Bifidobacterium aemilianum]RBP98477.1 single-stranded DNA-binding protein [Bifidobacterium aemilianum]